MYGAYEGGSPWALCPRLVGVLAVNGYAAVKDVDPAARVVVGNVLRHGDGGWVGFDYWREVEGSPAVAWYRANRGSQPWDAVGFHPYGSSPLDGGLRRDLRALRDVQRAHDDEAPIAISEYGWHTSQTDGDESARTDLQGQADLVEGTFRVAREEGVSFVVWFNYLDWDRGKYGLRRIAGGENGRAGAWKPSARDFCNAAGQSACPSD